MLIFAKIGYVIFVKDIHFINRKVTMNVILCREAKTIINKLWKKWAKNL